MMFSNLLLASWIKLSCHHAAVAPRRFRRPIDAVRDDTHSIPCDMFMLSFECQYCHLNVQHVQQTNEAAVLCQYTQNDEALRLQREEEERLRVMELDRLRKEEEERMERDRLRMEQEERGRRERVLKQREEEERLSRERQEEERRRLQDIELIQKEEEQREEDGQRERKDPLKAQRPHREQVQRGHSL